MELYIKQINRTKLKTNEKFDKWYFLKSEIEKTDKKIDEMVYKLYGLTEKGKKMIEKEYNCPFQ